MPAVGMRCIVTTLLPFALAIAVLFYDGPGQPWARHHLGDSLAVAFLVGALGAVTRLSLARRALLVAVVAGLVELGQLAAGAPERGPAMQLLIGGHFDPLDLGYYAIGLAVAAVLDRMPRRAGLGQGTGC